MDPMHDSEFDIAAQKTPPRPVTLVPFKGIPCLKCGETETVRLDLATMEFSCTACQNEWTVDDVHTAVEIWLRVLKWLGRVPTREEP